MVNYCDLYTHSTHWGRVMHICVGNLIIIGLDNGLSPGRHQAIIWTKAGILLIGPSGTNFSEILIEILTFSFKKMRLKMLSAKWWPFCLGLNVLIRIISLALAQSTDATLENINKISSTKPQQGADHCIHKSWHALYMLTMYSETCL